MRAGLIAGTSALLASVAAAKEPSPAALRKLVERALDRPAFAAAYWAVEVRSLRSGRVLYERNARKNMTPASPLKLVITAAEAEELDVALEDPALYAATAFVEALEERGIRVALGAASASEALPAGARVLAGHDITRPRPATRSPRSTRWSRR